MSLNQIIVSAARPLGRYTFCGLHSTEGTADARTFTATHMTSLGLLQCQLSQESFRNVRGLFTSKFQFSSFNPSVGIDNIIDFIANILGLEELCLAFQTLSEDRLLPCSVQRPLDGIFHRIIHLRRLYLDGLHEASGFVSSSVLNSISQITPSYWEEIVMLYCDIRARDIAQFLVSLYLRPRISRERPILQFKTFFCDCDFIDAAGDFHTSLRKSSVSHFRESYDFRNLHPLQFNDHEQGDVYMCSEEAFDVWLIDQADSHGNESSLHFCQNFEQLKENEGHLLYL
ncbi:hypothetical protein BT69DRAFT_634528 [Atractiella rhizophila]|nr:hypothetical protein BT69DRAFT_634528 [Atractiella rhizophila]